MIPGIRIVVLRHFRGLTPAIPAAFINRATLLPNPDLMLEAQLGVDPGRAIDASLASWICLIFSVSHASCSDQSDARGAPSYEIRCG